MNYGLQISSSGALTGMYRQDVLTNNLANLNTVGYKPSIPSVKARDPVRAEDGLAHLPSSDLLERLGAGVVPGPQRISFTQGPIQPTGNPLDLAVQGDGFFVVRGDNAQPALTRDGRFTLNDEGTLVMAATGHQVLDDRGGSIRLGEGGPVEVRGDGAIIRDGRTIANLQIADPEDRTALIKLGEGLFGPTPGTDMRLDDATGSVVQGAVEGSGVNEIRALMTVQAAARTAQSNLGMITYHDRLMDAAINRLGRSN
ncbi:MAG: flagellar hook-basal body protein [Planctomycetota bacterium]